MQSAFRPSRFHYSNLRQIMTLPTKIRRDGKSIIIRPARSSDAEGMTATFFHSFNQKFWQVFCPPTTKNTAWITSMWSKGIVTPTDRSFVAVDPSAGEKVIAFSRWQLPGNPNDDAWPEPIPLDRAIAEPFFGGMHDNRTIVMGDRLHICEHEFSL